MGSNPTRALGSQRKVENLQEQIPDRAKTPKGARSAAHSRGLGGVAQTSRALACQARGRRFESGRPRFVVAVV